MYGVRDDALPHTSVRRPGTTPHLAPPPEEFFMTIRIAAIEVSHWHAVHDAAYLHHLTAMPDVALVGVQDSNAELVKKRAAETGPDFVLGLGRHRQMAGIAHDLLDLGLPFLMEKPMGMNADEVQSVADK